MIINPIISSLPVFNTGMDKDELLVKIGDRIRYLRTQKGINQAELARRCNRERTWMGRIELGKINSSVYVLHIIARALEVKLSELTDINEG
ncbi:MAG: helix-turn-helix domain-containing protein [Owenweeksia sp.]